MRRLSISLDDETYKLVEKTQDETKTSKADVLRMLIRNYNEQKRIFKGADMETILIYLDYLQAGEHVILDVDLLYAIFEKLQDCSGEFCERIKQSGREHGHQYRKKGMKNLQDILYYISKSNLFRLKVDSPDFCTLILVSPHPGIRMFLKNFLDGVFESYPQDVRITESTEKLMVQLLR